MKKLEKQIKEIDKVIKKGESINLMYDGECIANYTETERTIDSKTPLQWLRGNICFLVTLKGRDIKKVTLEYHKS